MNHEKISTYPKLSTITKYNTTKYKLILSIKKQIHSQKLIISVPCNQPGGGLYERLQNLSLFQSKFLITVSCFKRPEREQTTYFSTDLKFEKI